MRVGGGGGGGRQVGNERGRAMGMLMWERGLIPLKEWKVFLLLLKVIRLQFERGLVKTMQKWAILYQCVTNNTYIHVWLNHSPHSSVDVSHFLVSVVNTVIPAMQHYHASICMKLVTWLNCGDSHPQVILLLPGNTDILLWGSSAN